MSVSIGKTPLMANKLIALAVVIVGFLVLASGYRYGSFMTAVGGGLLVGVGLALLVLKIARRNRNGAL